MNENPVVRYFPALTGLRFCAATMVLVFHYERSNPLYPQFLRSLLAEMYIGVSLFFVLSGFMIAHRYLFSNDFSYRSYLQNRFARIFPVLFLLATVTFLVRWLWTSPEPAEEWTIYWMSISFLKGFSKDYFLSGITQSWSLSVEEVFYILAPFFFALIRRSYLWLCVLPIALVVVGVVLVRFFSAFPFHGFFEDRWFMLSYTLFGRAVEFFSGIALAYLFHVQKNNMTSGWFTGLGLAGILAILGILTQVKGEQEFAILTPAGLAIHHLVLPLIGFAPLLWGLITGDNLLTRFLSSPLLQLLGRSSYCLYLIHLGIFQSLLSRISDNTLFLYPAMVLLSVVLFTTLEEPLHKYFRSARGLKSTPEAAGRL